MIKTLRGICASERFYARTLKLIMEFIPNNKNIYHTQCYSTDVLNRLYENKNKV